LHLQVDSSEPLKPVPLAPKNIVSEGKICANFDEWVYLRIYTGTGYSDRVLRDCIAPIMQEAQQSGLIDRWFFIRYKDQFEHLRLRFHSPHQADLMSTLVQLQARLKLARQDGLLWRIQTDDYVVEEERYAGKEGLALCEELFRLDSEDILRLLDIESDYQGDHARWVYAIASVDYYAQRLCPTLPQRERLLESLAESFLNEHSSINTRSTIVVALGGRFRDMRKQFDALRNGTPALDAWHLQLQKQAPARDLILDQLRDVISQLSEEKQLAVLQSLMHMHCNRLAPSDPRRHETVLYDFARRLERARQAKQRNAQQVQA
jgi:thiopeptide-type bacteriocin biosynthesis protein